MLESPFSVSSSTVNPFNYGMSDKKDTRLHSHFLVNHPEELTQPVLGYTWMMLQSGMTMITIGECPLMISVPKTKLSTNK